MTDASETERNRVLLTEAFARLEHGDPSAFLPLFDKEITWRVMGSSAWSKEARGLDAVERDLIGPLFARFTGPYRNIPELVLADGEHAVVLAKGDAETTDGQRYANDYCFVFRLKEGRIVEVREFMDGLLAERVLGG